MTTETPKKTTRKTAKNPTAENLNVEFEEIPQDTINENESDDIKPDDEPPAPQPTKRRGRPPGSKNKTTNGAGRPRKSAQRMRKDTETLGKQIVGIHHVIAMMTGTPEMQISDDEGLALATGINAVCEEYGLSLSGKTGATIQLVGAAGMIYVPRLVMINQRLNKERQRQENIIDGHIHEAQTE